MNNMASPIFIWHTESNQINDFKLGIKLALESQAKSLLILSCSQNGFQEKYISSILETIPIPLFGGMYPNLIVDKKLLNKGYLIVGFSDTVEICHFTEIQQLNFSELEKSIEKNDILNRKSNYLIFYDGLMQGVEVFLECLYESLGHETSCAGGGAGFLDFEQRPCVYSNQGLLTGVIQIVAIPEKLSVGFSHGWEKFLGPFLVSQSNDSIVETLNYEPAFELYKKSIESNSHYRFDECEFFDIAKHFPLGIESVNGDILVRDPILNSNDHLQCVGNVLVNSMVYILRGEISSLISAAKMASKEANKNSFDENQPQTTVIIFDCISRVLYMKDSFQQELSEIISECENRSVFGVLSIGEVANDQSGAIKLLNKSTVVGRF